MKIFWKVKQSFSDIMCLNSNEEVEAFPRSSHRKGAGTKTRYSKKEENTALTLSTSYLTGDGSAQTGMCNICRTFYLPEQILLQSSHIRQLATILVPSTYGPLLATLPVIQHATHTGMHMLTKRK